MVGIPELANIINTWDRETEFQDTVQISGTMPSESSYDVCVFVFEFIKAHQRDPEYLASSISFAFLFSPRPRRAHGTHGHQGSPRLFHRARARTPPLDFDFRSRAKRCVLKVSPIIMTNVRPRSENYSFRDRPGEGPHGNAGVKSTTGTNLTYLVIALTPSADTREIYLTMTAMSRKGKCRGSLCAAPTIGLPRL